jgi:ATP-dependent exoDNAse (exonuclease V) beta subunit
MTEAFKPTYLAEKNRHPRDEFIVFDEGPHIYTVHGQLGYTSVTTWVHQHFSHFDADAVIQKMVERGTLNNPANKYYGMTPKQIKKQWADNGKAASGSGTKMHYDIECYYNGQENPNDSPEYAYFKQFVADYPDLKPYRTEWMVYYEEIKISGSIDMIFENPDGTLLIYDWKRCEEIPYEDSYGKVALTPCISHLPDTKFWHYSLQLNIYKTILEHKYGKKVVGLFLMRLHPNSQTYDRIEVPILDKEITALIDERKQLING